MTVEYDFSDFRRLAADIEAVPEGAAATLKKAVQVTSHRVHDAWNEKLYSEGHAKRTRGSISYDVEVDRGGVTGEIGPYESRPQAYVVRDLENGTVNNPAHGYGAAALHENEADFEYGVQRAIDDAMKAAGL